MEKILIELSQEGQIGYSVPENDMGETDISKILPQKYMRATIPKLPQVSEPDLRRHFTKLSQLNYSLTTNFYPLGSCTMKYNPPVNEKIANLPGLRYLHPYQPENTVQGMLEILYELQDVFCQITGMDNMTLQPSAGAQGEFTGLLLIRAYFKSKNERRNKIIVPDSAHGTNPASAKIAGFEILPLHSEPDGHIDPAKLKEILTDDVAALMLTAPNTLGVFEKDILILTDMMHKNGSLLYYDGANLNALMGHARPGDLGFDIIHINLHKTFSTPHGGGGPGAGPVGVKKALEPFLPKPVINKNKNVYSFIYDRPKSIGKVRSFYGNIPVLIKAYCYIKALGREGLKKVSEQAVINANYLLAILKEKLPAPAGDRCMHEFILSGKPLNKCGVKTLDVAKRLLDYGYYAPTIYFPLIIEEAIMIEPTETESKSTLDEFARVLINILEEAQNTPDLLKNAPQNTPVSRLNEVEAARKPILRW
ncbi:MAG: aminomethyl-transferring glycine dehydrogenase subunit GcvPB [Elusimicrobia bacterium]|nr:aminomethyl-transferring glycine dehydrogenase subunit GcvPB [Candidatus Liberimonas magnetica]